MPARLEAPVLTVDVGLIHKVDTRNVENLFSMWTVFSRCSESLEQGRRLENLSWRLWNRETFCCDPVSEANTTTPSITRLPRGSLPSESTDVPSLSRSLDSLADEEAIESDTECSSDSTAPVDIPAPQIQRQDSSSSSRSRGRERHITPDDLKKMMISIKEEKVLEPFAPSVHSYLTASVANAPLPQLSAAVPPQTTAALTAESGSLTSDSASANSSPPTLDSASGTSERSTTSVVRGFSPSHVSSSFRSVPLPAAASTPVADLAPATPSKGRHSKKPGMFTLGGSSAEDSLSEQADSLETRAQQPPPKKKAAVFSFGGSSNEDESSLPQNMVKGPLANGHKKSQSFKDMMATGTIQEEHAIDDDVFDETEDEDDIDESAIDDDEDSSDWEDSVEDSGNPSIDEKTFFQRVDSRPTLTSRRSLITTMLHQSDRANALAQAATNSKSTPAFQRSRASSPNGPSLAASPDSDDQGLMMVKKGGLKPIAEIPRSRAQPINKPAAPIAHQQALSPRTTRRKMINDELTVSLRQHLVWEHRQKSQTANAVLQRRHTTQDVANLKQYPDRLHMNSKEGDGVNASWNQYFGNGLGEYHSKGW